MAISNNEIGPNFGIKYRTARSIVTKYRTARSIVTKYRTSGSIFVILLSLLRVRALSKYMWHRWPKVKAFAFLIYN